jgi:hypothetical protein
MKFENFQDFLQDFCFPLKFFNILFKIHGNVINIHFIHKNVIILLSTSFQGNDAKITPLKAIIKKSRSKILNHLKLKTAIKKITTKLDIQIK